jgi:hypothetical protein
MRARVLTAVLSLTLATSLGVLTVSTQQSGTLTLKNGQVLTGELVDLGGGGFTFRVNGQNREIARADVASIDFGGDTLNAPEGARTLAADTALVVLRNGNTLTGEFYDVGGTQPLRLTFRNSAGERVLDANDVRRIYLARVDGATAAASFGPPTATITVSSRQAWTNTGLTVREGQTIHLATSGEITFSPRNHRATVVGSVDNLLDAKAPMPRVLQGALLGRVGLANSRTSGGTVFAIGNQATIVAPASGPLFLGVNDSGVNDNRGDFTVAITLVP